MRYEWNEAKAGANLTKHGVRFADAPSVLEDEHGLTVPDDSTDEERFATVGMDAHGRVLVIIWTWRSEDRIRIISARRATPRERRQYENPT